MKVESVAIGLFQAQSHIVIDEESREAAIVDTGENGEGIAGKIARLDVRPVIVLLTHGHLDHAGGLARVRRDFPDVPIAMPEADLPFVLHMTEQARMFGVHVEPPPKIDRFLADGEVIAVGGGTHLRAIATPGHTPGGTTFFEERARAAFVGDTLFDGSIGRTDLPGGSLRTLLKSIREKLFSLGDDVVCYTGHGPTTTIGRERVSNPFLQPGVEDELGLLG